MYRRNGFFSGRNGPDSLSIATSFLACLLLIIAMFLDGPLGSVLWLLALVCLILSYFRILSRNLAKRQRENAWFQARIRPLTDLKARHRAKKRQKNLYCFFQCPQCSTVLRVPKGKGHIRITCRCCGHIFERNS
jgi:hypothetical protein